MTRYFIAPLHRYDDTIVNAVRDVLTERELIEFNEYLARRDDRIRAEDAAIRRTERWFDMLCTAAFITLVHAMDIHSGWQVVLGIALFVIAGVFMQLRTLREPGVD
jgi:hypothetical protein